MADILSINTYEQSFFNLQLHQWNMSFKSLSNNIHLKAMQGFLFNYACCISVYNVTYMQQFGGAPGKVNHVCNEYIADE